MANWLAEITPTVLAEEQWFAKGSFWSITPSFERFDVVVEPVSEHPRTLFPAAIVFDHDGLTASFHRNDRPRAPAPSPSSSRTGSTSRRCSRRSCGARTGCSAAEHLHFLRDLLYKLYVETNQPLPPMGLKRWSEKLTPTSATRSCDSRRRCAT